MRERLAQKGPGLVSVINCAGLGFTGPAEYFPMDLYRRQMDVNFFGYVRVEVFHPITIGGARGGGGGSVESITFRISC